MKQSGSAGWQTEIGNESQAIRTVSRRARRRCKKSEKLEDQGREGGRKRGEVAKQSSGRAGPRAFPDAGGAKPEAVTGSPFTGTKIIKKEKNK